MENPEPISAADHRWLDAAARLAARGRPLSRPNPAVGAILVKDGKVATLNVEAPGKFEVSDADTLLAQAKA